MSNYIGGRAEELEFKLTAAERRIAALESELAEERIERDKARASVRTPDLEHSIAMIASFEAGERAGVRAERERTEKLRDALANMCKMYATPYSEWSQAQPSAGHWYREARARLKDTTGTK